MEIREVSENVLQVHLNGEYIIIFPLRNDANYIGLLITKVNSFVF